MQTTTLQRKRALRTALLVLLLSAVGMGKGYAQDDYFVVDDLWYTFNGDNSVTLGGPNAYITTLHIPSSVTYTNEAGETNTYAVTRIRGHAFDGGYFITGDLVIPNSIIEIGEAAFNDCSGFSGSLTIGNSVTAIGQGTFRNCSGFTGDLTIGNFVTSIGDSAFENCSGFTGNLTIGNSVTSIGNRAFKDCSGFTGALIIPNSVTSIGGEAFLFCSGFTSLSLGSSVTEIWGYAFFGCTGFTGTLTIPNSVTNIDYQAFYKCSGFTGDLYIPSSVTSLGYGPFGGCDGIERVIVDIENPIYDSRDDSNAIIITNSNRLLQGFSNTTIPNTITSIGTFSFLGCLGITTIVIPESVTSIGTSAFLGCRNLVELNLPNSLTYIGEEAFSLCSGLTGTLVIPNSVRGIGEFAFEGCSGFTGLVLGNSVSYIGRLAFYDCSGFTGSLIIPNSVTEIWNCAFMGCVGFENCIVLSETPPQIYYFEECPTFDENLTHLIVPCGCKAAYEASDWASYFTVIDENCGTHSINIDNISSNGGSVSLSSNSANLGDEVQITVTPNAGMSLSSLVVCNANDPSQTVPVYPIGKASSTYGFTMPYYDVTIKAVFTHGNAVGEDNSIAASVYPNPTSGQVKIEAEGLKQVTISDMLGQVVYDGEAEGDAFEYDFSNNEAGVYLVRIETASGIVVKKVSVAR